MRIAEGHEVIEAVFVEMDPLREGFRGVLVQLVATGEGYAVVETVAGTENRLRKEGAKMGREAGLRLELFVEDMEASIAFYTRVLAFELARHEPGDYANVRLGGVILGIGPVAKLPEEGGYFGTEIATLRRGLGVEIVIEVDDVDGWHERLVGSGHPIVEPLQERSWGLRDFRISDPDGYYLRVTSRPAGD